jgi:hypothetical protein
MPDGRRVTFQTWTEDNLLLQVSCQASERSTPPVMAALSSAERIAH